MATTTFDTGDWYRFGNRWLCAPLRGRPRAKASPKRSDLGRHGQPQSRLAQCTHLCLIIGAAQFCLTLLAWLFQHAMALPDALRIVISAALIAPLAFFMGMPFPLGLARVEASDARLVPWAWAINGCASVTGAVLATLLAIHVGFTAVVVVALVLYGVAAAARP